MFKTAFVSRDAMGKNTSVIPSDARAFERERERDAFFKTSFKLPSQTGFGFIWFNRQGSVRAHVDPAFSDEIAKKEKRWPLIIASLLFAFGERRKRGREREREKEEEEEEERERERQRCSPQYNLLNSLLVHQGTS